MIMKLYLDRPRHRLPGMWESFSLAILIGAAVLIPLSMHANVHVPTSFLRFFGGACPLCGGTRAVTALCMGHFDVALQYNPLALFIFGAMLYGALTYLFVTLPFGRRLLLYTSDGEARFIKAFILLALAANWAYVLYAGMYQVPLQV